MFDLYYRLRNFLASWKRLRRARREYSPRIYAVLKLAIRLHGDQRRRYTQDPYWFHVENVMRTLLRKGIENEIVLAAALLHDTLEDVEDFYAHQLLEELRTMYSEPEARQSLRLVMALTDEFTHQKYPQLKRKFRKILERSRFSSAPFEAKLIRLADMSDNTQSIRKFDEAFFFSTYQEEKEALLKMLTESDYRLLWFSLRLRD